MNIFTQFFKQKPQDIQKKKQSILRDLMRREADINRNLFGPVPKGTKRDFFCLDKDTWIWYEAATDKTGAKQELTTKYLIRDNEIVKSLNGGSYNKLTPDEVKNFQKAANKYVNKTSKELYISHQHSSSRV